MKEERGEGITDGGDKKQILPKAWEGKRFGDLVVVSYAGKRKGNITGTVSVNAAQVPLSASRI